jgi:hypothetical protein
MAMRPEPVRAVRVNVPEPHSLTVTLLDLAPGACKWPSGTDDISALTFCGHPRCEAVAGGAPSPYCEHHTARAYPPDRVRDRLDRRLGVSP